ncbi:hypothetical protein HJ590_10370 [Naumannella sp. ID2617S]|nr:hypothetical protein [Naumannella sp. ID2617S]
MTQYLISVIHEAGVQEREFGPYADEAAMMDAFRRTGEFNDKLMKDNKWVFAGGLTAPSDATVVDGTGSDPVVTDGPFAESKEYLGGFWVIEADDLDEAIRLAAEGSNACGSAVEVRPLQGA